MKGVLKLDTPKQLLIRYAVKLAAACNPKYDTLHEATTELLYGNTSMSIDEREILSRIDYDTCSHLFFDYGLSQPDKIRSVVIVKKSFAELWFLTYIARNYEQLTSLKLKELVEKKFQMEKACDPKLPREKYAEWLLKQFSSTEKIFEFGQCLWEISRFADEAIKNMNNYFEQVLRKKKFLEIYTLSELSEMQAVKEEKPVAEVSKIPELKQKIEKLEEVIGSLKSDKRLLETKVHKMQVDMEFMKKDLIRNLLCEMSNPSYGYPLSELYLYSNDEQVNEKVRGTIKNLFTTVGNAGVKLIKATDIGKVLTFDEQTSEKYETYKYHEFKNGDEVYVCYPGYRYEYETIVKPTIKRKDI